MKRKIILIGSLSLILWRLSSAADRHFRERLALRSRYAAVHELEAEIGIQEGIDLMEYYEGGG